MATEEVDVAAGLRVQFVDPVFHQRFAGVVEGYPCHPEAVRS